MRLEAAAVFSALGVRNTKVVQGFKVVIEAPKGTVRLLKDDSGKVVYKKQMMSDYGFIANTTGRDGDEVDVLVGPVPSAKEVYVVHMIDKGPVPSEREDEDKVMLGYPSADSAKAAFLAHYPVSFFGGMTTLPLKTFKKRLAVSQLPYRHKKIHAGIVAVGV